MTTVSYPWKAFSLECFIYWGYKFMDIIINYNLGWKFWSHESDDLFKSWICRFLRIPSLKIYRFLQYNTYTRSVENTYASKSCIILESRAVFVQLLMNQWYSGCVSTTIFKPIAYFVIKRVQNVPCWAWEHTMSNIHYHYDVRTWIFFTKKITITSWNRMRKAYSSQKKYQHMTKTDTPLKELRPVISSV